MEGVHIFKKNPVNIAHFPTLMLVIGYPLFWAELFSGHAREGVTSPAVWWLFAFFVFFILLRERNSIAESASQYRQMFFDQTIAVRIFLTVGFILGLFILTCALLAALQPPYLMQESDVMNYHMSVPRQHLILGSFAHIPWSADDLFFLPLDFALAPFWFVSPLPNKFPQFIFLLGLLGVVVNMCRELKPGGVMTSIIAVFALLGSHGHGVQMGTAMLDLPICYLFIAAIDSFLKKQKWLFIVEFSFLIWSKSLMALQMGSFFGLLACLYFLMRAVGIRKVLFDFQRPVKPEDVAGFRQFLTGVLPVLILVSVCVGGPFLAKSLYYSGTPFFPVNIGSLAHPGIPEGSVAWASLERSAHFMTRSIHNDGYGRSVIDFITHFWALAVPSEGVNNAFDYPMGLAYLLFWGPFVFYLVRSLRNKEFAVLPWIIVCCWVLWWFTVREARYLYAPVLLMILVTAVSMTRYSRILLVILLSALILNAASVFRAHRSSFGQKREDVLRTKDRVLADLSTQYLLNKKSGAVELTENEVAFALFPVVVRRENLPHVIEF